MNKQLSFEYTMYRKCIEKERVQQIVISGTSHYLTKMELMDNNQKKLTRSGKIFIHYNNCYKTIYI